MLLTVLLAAVSLPRAPAVWLGRLDPKQVAVLPYSPRGTSVLGARLVGATQPRLCGGAEWAGLWEGRLGSQAGGSSSPTPSSAQLLGSWYVLAVASGEKGFAAEKATKNIEGVVVTLTPENSLKVRSWRHR